MPLPCLTPSDIRGRVPDELNPALAARLALAFARHFACRHVVLGRDARLSSPELAAAVRDALLAAGVNITDLGLCGTEEMYFAVFNGERAGVDGGIMLTASHNPAEYNGMKFVGRGALPVSRKSGLEEVARLAEVPDFQPPAAKRRGAYFVQEDKSAYVKRLLAIAPAEGMSALKVVVNSGHGCAGPAVDALAPHLPLHLIRVQHEPDGTFPEGVPNPLLPERRAATTQAVLAHKADLGVAWDGDFDRCFFFDEQGRFVESAYIVGLLAETLLRLHPGATILHDARVIWNTQDQVLRAGGTPVMVKSGHARIKESMRQHQALYGGEMSAHHYFKDFGFCDSGMLPWLLICRLLAETGKPLSALLDERIRAFPVSGEINFKLKKPASEALTALKNRYQDAELDETDGVSLNFSDFRCNLRPSSTEPLLRLNLESRGDTALLQAKTDELLAFLRAFT